VTDAAQVEAMIERAVGTYGRLDAAFNNAGVNSEAAAFLDISDSEFERVMNVNLRGVWNCMKGELRQMMAQGSGAIVNCSSIGGLKGSIGRSAYSASKHAVIGLARSAALDYAAKGHPHQRGLPGNGQHADGNLRHEELRSGNRAADGGARTHRTLR
jgi:NAD(P)-dependent dehydrogenase (short-subunit alcohol dehydrogenase family)